MKNVIVKADAHNRAVIFFADTAAKGQIDCFVDGTVKRVGLDWYALAKPLDEKEVVKTVEAFREVTHTPEEEINIRARLKKGYARNSAPEFHRRLDDQKPAQIIHAAHIEQPLRRAEDKPQEIVEEDVAEKDPVVSVIEAIHNNESDKDIADKFRAATFSETRKQRKAKRVEAAKRRYEAEVAATNANMQSAVAHAGNVQQAAPEATITLTESQLGDIIAKAVASAMTAVSHVVAA